MLALYLDETGAACGLGGGCDVVRASAWASLGPIPMPALGLLFFVALGASLVVPGARSRRIPAMLGGAGILAGASLLAVQAFVIEAWCPYCVAIDLTTIAVGLIVQAPRLRDDEPVAARWPVASGAAAGLVLGIGVPIVLSSAASDRPPPAGVAAAPVEPSERVTIVEYVDFQCPFCRRQYATLADILQDYGARVQVEYRHVPLPMHEHAAEAAAVACCAEEQGLALAVVDRLFRAGDLSPAGCRSCAAQAGADLSALERCLDSQRPGQRLAEDAQAAGSDGIRRLPTCIIGGARLEGLQSEQQLRASLDAALRG
jgi:protein-disulfide isomerase